MCGLPNIIDQLAASIVGEGWWVDGKERGGEGNPFLCRVPAFAPGTRVPGNLFEDFSPFFSATNKEISVEDSVCFCSIPKRRVRTVLLFDSIQKPPTLASFTINTPLRGRVTIKTCHGVAFPYGAVRTGACGITENRTAPFNFVLAIPHRTVGLSKTKIGTAPHRTIQKN